MLLEAEQMAIPNHTLIQTIKSIARDIDRPPAGAIKRFYQLKKQMPTPPSPLSFSPCAVVAVRPFGAIAQNAHREVGILLDSDLCYHPGDIIPRAIIQRTVYLAEGNVSWHVITTAQTLQEDR